MAIIPGTVTSQEKLAGALAYLLFPIPMIMNVKTEFTVFQSKQSFGLFCISIIAMIIGFIPFIGGFIRFIICLGLFVVGCWSAYQAYLGNKFVVPGITEYTNMAIAKLGIAQFFQV